MPELEDDEDESELDAEFEGVAPEMATSDDLESVEDYVSGDEFVNEAEIEES